MRRPCAEPQRTDLLPRHRVDQWSPVNPVEVDQFEAGGDKRSYSDSIRGKRP